MPSPSCLELTPKTVNPRPLSSPDIVVGVFRWAFWILALPAAISSAQAEIPTPESHFGHQMGADRELVSWADTVSYYRAVSDADPRVQFSELGKTTEGRPFVVVTVAASDVLADLDRHQKAQQSLSDPRRTTPEQAQGLISEGKAIVLLTCSIHSTEVASTMTAIEFLHKLLTEDTPRHRAILDNVILLLVPSLNPDGVDKVAQWYQRWVGTEYEAAPMVELYHKYTGHDNNRDWYMFTQQETRLAVRSIHNAWRPQVVYDVHQMGSTGARIFVPPWIDPIDPNIDPLIAQQANAFGTQMAADLTAAGKKGVVVNGIYDYFTPARHYQSYHGGVRLLSESASAQIASPIQTPFEALDTKARGYNAQQPSWNFLEPWAGGSWKLRDIVDYQLVAFESVLYNAALRREDLLRNFYTILRRGLTSESISAFVLPREQHDPNALTRLIETLDFGLVEIERARRDFSADGKPFSEGDYVVRLNQPYGRFAKTLLETQDYPDLRLYPDGPPRRPYDVTAHTLPLLMGVDVAAIEEPIRTSLRKLAKIEPPRGVVAAAAAVKLSPASSNAWIAVNRLLRAEVEVRRNRTNGDFYVDNTGDRLYTLRRLADTLGIEFHSTSEEMADHRKLRVPRVGLYSGFVPIMDEGWTRWVLDKFEFEYSSLDNARLQAGALADDFDVIILPDATPKTLQGGYVMGAAYRGAKAPPEYTGGIEESGAEALRGFAASGGTILAFNRASSYAIERLGLAVEDVTEGVGNDRFYSPGSLLKTELDTTHPLCFGMREHEAMWFESGPVFRPTYEEGAPRPETIVRYAGEDVLASGWLLGEEYLRSRSAIVEVALGQGRIVLFGIRPQYRGQPNATFKLVFNGLFYWEE